jgi:hypothetical protein
MLSASELKTLARALSEGTEAKALVHRELSLIAQLAAHEKLLWDTYCGKYGLKPSDRGKVFRVGKNKYTAVGINIRSHKTPIRCQRLTDGREFAMPVDQCMC